MMACDYSRLVSEVGPAKENDTTPKLILRWYENSAEQTIKYLELVPKIKKLLP